MSKTSAGRIERRRPVSASRRLAVGAAVVACMALSACSAATDQPGSGPPPAAKQSVGAHDRQARELRDVMRSYDQVVRTNVPGNTDLYDRWQGVFPKMADAAEALRASAMELSGHPPGKLELPERGRFQVLARSLAEAAGELEQAAARGDADAVPIARTNVARACRDCHDRFRPDASGVPDAFR